MATSAPIDSCMATARSGGKGHGPAVDVRLKDGLFFGDFDAVGEAEQLEPAAVGQRRSGPSHEAVQSTVRGDHVLARPQGEVVGVAEDHFCPGGAKLLDFQPLDRGLRADGHEGGQLHVAVRRRENAPPRPAAGVGVEQPIRKRLILRQRHWTSDGSGVFW